MLSRARSASLLTVAHLSPAAHCSRAQCLLAPAITCSAFSSLVLSSPLPRLRWMSSALPPLHRSGSRPTSSPAFSSLSPSLSPSSPPATPTSLSSPSSAPLLQPPTTFFCYLLRSLSPRHGSHTYIGFTTSPLRRLRQHNGDITAGAWRTSRKRPWEIVCVVYGFTSKIIALQFEWHWTYPRKSRRMRGVMGLRRWAGGVRGKVEVLYQLLASDPWRFMPLHVLFASPDGWKVHELIAKRSEREKRDWAKAAQRETAEERDLSLLRRHIYALPPHMSLTVGPLDELDIYRYLRQKRSRQKRREADAAPDGPSPIPPREDDDAALFDDDGPVSGEESLNSGDSDVNAPNDKDEVIHSDEDVILESPLASTRSSAPTRFSSVTSTSSSKAGAVGSSSPPAQLSSRLRCSVCFGSAELGDARSAHFFSGCHQCAFVGHLACMAQVIFRQMAAVNRTREDAFAFPLTQPAAAPPSSPSSSLSSPQRSTSSALAASAAPLGESMFSSVPASLPLIPPPSTGSCPQCHAAWSWPLLVERCRWMHVDSKGRRGGDVWYDEADRYSMASLVRQWAGRGGEEKKRKKDEEKQQRQLLKDQAKLNKKPAKRKASAVEAGAEAKAPAAGVEAKASTPSPRVRRGNVGRGSGSDSDGGSGHRSDDSSIGAARGRKGRRRADKENEGVSRATSPEWKLTQPTVVSRRVERRVEMHDGAPLRPSASLSTAAPFSASQPTLPSAVAASPSRPKGQSPFKGVISLSDFEDDEEDEEMNGVSGRRRLLGQASERRFGIPAHRFDDVTEEDLDVQLLPHRAGGESRLVSSKEERKVEEDDSKWVRLDDDEDESAISSAIYTEVDEDDDVDVVLSLADRLQGKANSAGLGASLSSIR